MKLTVVQVVGFLLNRNSLGWCWRTHLLHLLLHQLHLQAGLCVHTHTRNILYKYLFRPEADSKNVFKIQT